MEIPGSSLEPVEPMHLGRAPLSPFKRQRRLSLRVYLYCGESDHYIASYPFSPSKLTSLCRGVDERWLYLLFLFPEDLPGTLMWKLESLHLNVLVDSEADGWFISQVVVEQAKIP